mgnify:CR=1 FL=1
MVKPCYVFSGFLDSGKTTAIKDILGNDFNEGDKVLIIALEMGDEEYDDDFLAKTNSEVIYFSGLNELTTEKMAELDARYDPDMIFVELNGMEDDSIFYQTVLDDWIIVNSLTFFDARNLKLYMTNMRQFVYNHVLFADYCYINRCKPEDTLYFRNSLKSINQKLGLIFMDENGEQIKNIEQKLFDTSKDLEISDTDYGLWYIDAVDNPQKYEGKRIKLKAKFVEEVDGEPNACVMGRKAMVCCSNDLQDIALTVLNVDPKKINRKGYQMLDGVIELYEDENGEPTCVLVADKVEEADAPLDELVYFN